MPNKPIIRNEQTGRVTKQGHALMVSRAQELLKAAGFNVDEPGSGLVAADLVREFSIQRRTANQIEAQAARLLRGESVQLWRSGRPRNAELSDWQRRQLERLREIEQRAQGTA